MNISTLQRIGICTLTVLCFSALPIPVSADADIMVSPATLDLQVAPGDTVTATVKIINNANEDRSFAYDLRTFNSGDDDGKPLLDDTLDTPLHTWIKINTDIVTVPAKQTQEVTVEISPVAHASPGSYRTALLFRDNAVQPDANGSAIATEIGPLLFVTVTGEAREEATIANFAAHYILNETLPVLFDLQLNNTGNMDLTPVGVININPVFAMDNQVYRTNFNSAGAKVLAQTRRTLEGIWEADGWHFGYYHAQLVLAYGSTNTVLTADTYFWALPLKLLVIAIVILMAILGLILHRRNVYNARASH